MLRSSSSSTRLPDLYHTKVEGSEYLLDHDGVQPAKSTRSSRSPILWLLLHVVLLSLAGITFIFGSARLQQASAMSSERQSAYCKDPHDIPGIVA